MAKIVCGVTWEWPQSGHTSHSLRENKFILCKAHNEATRIQKEVVFVYKYIKYCFLKGFKF